MGIHKKRPIEKQIQVLFYAFWNIFIFFSYHFMKQHNLSNTLKETFYYIRRQTYCDNGFFIKYEMLLWHGLTSGWKVVNVTQTLLFSSKLTSCFCFYKVLMKCCEHTLRDVVQQKCDMWVRFLPCIYCSPSRISWIFLSYRVIICQHKIDKPLSGSMSRFVSEMLYKHKQIFQEQ